MSDNHPSFTKPDGDTTIWRYMNFLKFMSLLEKRALFFSNMTILRQGDNHEGTYNDATINEYEEKPVSMLHHVGSDMLRNFGRFIAVNCWHMNKIESTGMWDVYLRGEFGVAIQSTVERLGNAMQKPEGVFGDISIGKVNYLNEDEPIPEPDGFNALNAALWKRNSYQYEQELRAVAVVSPEQSYKYSGVYVPVELGQLVQRIVISPKAPRWYSELISSISEKYQLGERVAQSRLDRNPGTIADTRLLIKWPCPQCQTSQEVYVEPFIVKELSNDSTVTFSADRIRTHCQSCGILCIVTLKHSEEQPDSNTNDER